MPDLRELLELARDDAPAGRLDVDDIVAAGRRRRRWAIAQRIGGAGVVAAAAAAAATVLVVAQGATGNGAGTGTRVGSPPKAEVPVVAKPAPPFTFTFDGYTAGTYRVVEPNSVTATTQRASILGPAKDPEGKPVTWVLASLTVFQPGAYNPDKLPTDTKLTVLGRDAYQTTVPVEVISSIGPAVQNGTTQSTVEALVWQYADNAWAVIADEHYRNQPPIPLADKVSVAELLRPEIQVTARLPFRVGFLPAGWTLQSVSGRSFTAEDTGMVSAVYAAPNAFPAGTPSDAMSWNSTVPAVVIAIGQLDTPPPDAPTKKDTCLAGQHWCTWTIPGTGYYLAVNDPAKTLSDAELLRIGQSLTFADFAVPETWTPVA